MESMAKKSVTVDDEVFNRIDKVAHKILTQPDKQSYSLEVVVEDVENQPNHDLQTHGLYFPNRTPAFGAFIDPIADEPGKSKNKDYAKKIKGGLTKCIYSSEDVRIVGSEARFTVSLLIDLKTIEGATREYLKSQGGSLDYQKFNTLFALVCTQDLEHCFGDSSKDRFLFKDIMRYTKKMTFKRIQDERNLPSGPEIKDQTIYDPRANVINLYRKILDLSSMLNFKE